LKLDHHKRRGPSAQLVEVALGRQAAAFLEDQSKAARSSQKSPCLAGYFEITFFVKGMSTEVASTKLPVILLVEDSEDDTFFFRRALRRIPEAHQLFHVADGSEALDFLGRKGSFSTPEAAPKPNIIFLDLKLPKFSGFEVLRWIKAHGLGSAFKVVVLSGSDQEADRKLARELGAADYVVKPLQPDYLRSALESLPSH
jgi:CheY-like chemotaxis protein